MGIRAMKDQGGRPTGSTEPPPPPNIPRAPTLLDPAVEAARLNEQQRQRKATGFTGTVLTQGLGAIGGTPLPRLTGG